MGLMTGFLVDLDCGVVEDHPLLFNLRIAAKQIDTSGPERFHLGPQKGNPGLESLEDEVISKCLPIRDNVSSHEKGSGRKEYFRSVPAKTENDTPKRGGDQET